MQRRLARLGGARCEDAYAARGSCPANFTFDRLLSTARRLAAGVVVLPQVCGCRRGAVEPALDALLPLIDGGRHKHCCSSGARRPVNGRVAAGDRDNNGNTGVNRNNIPTS